MEGLIKDPNQAKALQDWILKQQLQEEQRRTAITNPETPMLLKKMARDEGRTSEDLAMDMASSMTPIGGAAATLKGIPKTGNILKDAGDMIGRIKAGAVESPKDFNSVMKMFKDLVKEGGQKAQNASQELSRSVDRIGPDWRGDGVYKNVPESLTEKGREISDLAPSYRHFSDKSDDIVSLPKVDSAATSSGNGDVIDFGKSIKAKFAQKKFNDMKADTGKPLYRADVERYLEAKSPDLYQDENLASSVANKFANMKNLEKAKSGEFLTGVNTYAIGKDAARASTSVRNRATNQIKQNMKDLEDLGRKIEAEGPKANPEDINFYDEMRNQLREQMQELKYTPNQRAYFPEGQRLRGGDVIEDAKDLFAFTPPKLRGEGRTKVLKFKKRDD